MSDEASTPPDGESEALYCVLSEAAHRPVRTLTAAELEAMPTIELDLSDLLPDG